MMKPFIPSWLDESSLPANQFRVLAHLWRRADKAGRCYPGGKSIAAICKIHPDTVWRVLAALEEAGHIKRLHTRGKSNQYLLQIPPGNEGVTHIEGVTHNEGVELPGLEGLGLPASEGFKGIPIKEVQESESIITGKAVDHSPKGKSRKKTKNDRVESNTDLMNQIGGWFGRRPDTLWSKADAETLEAINPHPDDIADLGEYYDVHPDEIIKIYGGDYRRRSLSTLLNQWANETDRARLYRVDRDRQRKPKPHVDGWAKPLHRQGEFPEPAMTLPDLPDHPDISMPPPGFKQGAQRSIKNVTL